MKSVKELIANNIPLMDRINQVSFFCLGLTTAWTANRVALEKLDNAIPNQHLIAAIIAVLVAIAIAWIFDYGLRKNFISSLLMFNADDFKSAKWSLKLIVVGFLIIALFRFSLSTGATFISSIFISDDLVEDGNTEQLEKMLSDKEKTKQDITLSLARQIKDIRTDAERRANGVVSAAIEKGGKRWAKLWTTGNSWVRTVKGGNYRHVEKWREGIYKAEKQADEIRQEASKQIAALQSSQTNLIEAETKDQSFATITQIKANQIKKLEAKENITKVSLWMLDGVFSFIAILTSFGLSAGIKCREDYELFKEETSLMDVGMEGMNASKRIMLSYLVAGVAKIDAKAQRVATTLSNGEGYLQLEAETLKMYRKPPSQIQTPNPDRLQIGSTVDIHNASPTNFEWSVGRTPTSADKRVPTSADNADKKRQQPADTNKNAPSNRVADTADKKSVVVNTTVINGIPYVDHVGRNGKTVKWTMRDVEKNLHTYQTRMESAKENGKQKVYENNKEKVELLESYIDALKELT